MDTQSIVDPRGRAAKPRDPGSEKARNTRGGKRPQAGEGKHNRLERNGEWGMVFRGGT